MGCCQSEEERKSASISKAATAKQAARKKNQRDIIRLLLVGAGESGKSTVLKQMKILNHGGNAFSMRDVNEFTAVARDNLWKSFQEVLAGAEDLKIAVDEKSHEATMYVRNNDCSTKMIMDSKAHLSTLIADPGIQEALSRTHEFPGHILDSAKYWFSNFERVMAPDYVPSHDDILRTRQATAGVIETKFVIEKSMFEFIDVGGQRGERRKWIHCFDHISAMFYVSSLSGYSQVLDEDTTQNRLRESLSLFRGLLGLPWFARTPVILFLNKDDVFREKIKKIPLQNFFAEFKPAPGVDIYDESRDFIKDLFIFQARNVAQFLGSVYPHITNATNTDNIKYVWEDARKIVIAKSIENSLGVPMR